MGTGIRDIRHTTKGFQPNELFTDRVGTNRVRFEEPQPFLPQNPFLDIVNGTDIDVIPPSGASPDGDSNDDAFSDFALTFISQILMEEDDKVDNFHEYAALQAAEKPFYEILGQKYPLDSSPSSDDSFSTREGNSSCGPSSSSSSSGAADGISIYDFPEYKVSPVRAAPVDFSSQFSFGSMNGPEVREDYLDGLSELFRESEPAWQFRKGEEEALKFLPSEHKLVIDLEVNGYSFPLWKVKPEKEDGEFTYPNVSRARKNPHDDDFDLEEGRSTKLSAVSFEEATPRSNMFDQTLLCNGNKFPKAISDLREAYHIGPNGSTQSGSSTGRGRGKKQQPKKEVTDLSTLLTHCAQMVAADDRRGSSDMLKQIRQNSSPFGDGSQRLAHYFANGLEARLAGIGSEAYNLIKQQRRTATDYLKAYQLYLAVCPFKKISYFFSNQHILDISKTATRVHVVDFGIDFGFQWPSLMQCMSSRPGGSPRLRITGVDLPLPGFRPRERLDETGRRLADYAKLFNVPFEYKGISSRLEDVSIEELEIDKDEVLVVNSLFVFRRLAEETVSAVNCPRNAVLSTINKMKPDIFIQGIVNGTYSAPFFVTRFREALFFFSGIFDMLETNVPREDEARQLIEREVFGREIMNIVACEGAQRVERPETYKQWQARNLRAGLVPRPLNRDMCKKAKEKVRDHYNKDFVIDEDGRWLIQGWKGRVLFALSSWKSSDPS